MSAIYEVRLEVDALILNAFLEWLRPHLDAVVAAGGFVKAELFREERDDELEVLICHYHARSLEDVRNYIANKSGPLREDGVRRFGTGFRASRRILVGA